MSARRHRPVSVERDAALYALGLDPENVEWHHEPPLSVRPFTVYAGVVLYSPDENDPRHIVPMAPAAHAKRTPADITVAAKVTRITKDQEVFRQRLLAKDRGEPRKKSRLQGRGFR